MIAMPATTQTITARVAEGRRRISAVSCRLLRVCHRQRQRCSAALIRSRRVGDGIAGAAGGGQEGATGGGQAGRARSANRSATGSFDSGSVPSAHWVGVGSPARRGLNQAGSIGTR